EELHRRQDAEDVLVAAAINVGGGAPAVDVGNAILLGDRALRLHERGLIGAEQEIDLLAGDETVGQADRGRLVGGIVEELERYRQLAAAHLEAAVLVRLFEGEVITLLVEAADASLTPGERQRRADDDGGAVFSCRPLGFAAGGDRKGDNDG